MADVFSGIPAPRMYPPDAVALPTRSMPVQRLGQPAERVDALDRSPRPATPDAGAPTASMGSNGYGTESLGTGGYGTAITGSVGDLGERGVEGGAPSGRVAVQTVDRLRGSAEGAADRGTTTIADEVVRKITAIAARQVPGVFDLGGDVARVFAAVRERVGLADADDDADRGVSVRLDGDTATVKVVLVIEYGSVVRAVTEAVRTNVIASVERMLGLSVAAVDIVVDDVHVEESVLP